MKTNDRAYSRLFQSKLLTLIATGVTTVAMSVIAFEIAGRDASALLGAALSAKALAYVLAPPFVSAVVERFSRGRLLILLDILRGLIVFSLIFITSELLLFVLVAVFLAGSAAFKVTYHEYVAHLMPDQRDYARALSKSQIVDELESATSPLLAAALLLIFPLDGLLRIMAAAFILSAWRISSAGLPNLASSKNGSPLRRSTEGMGLIFSEPHLQPLPYLAIAMAAGTAMVMTTTPVIVQGILGLGARETAIAFSGFGVGAVLAALAWGRSSQRFSERPTMLAGSTLIAAGLLCGTLVESFVAMVLLWAVIGFGVMLIQAPAALIIRRNVGDASLHVAFGAGLALQNAALLVLYLLAGWLSTMMGTDTAFLILGMIAGLAALKALHLWTICDRQAHADVVTGWRLFTWPLIRKRNRKD